MLAPWVMSLLKYAVVLSIVKVDNKLSLHGLIIEGDGKWLLTFKVTFTFLPM